MTSIATLGPEGSHAWQAARQYNPDAAIQLYPKIGAVIEAFLKKQTEQAIIPVYNTREGEVKEYFRMMENLSSGYWTDNILLPIHLSLGTRKGITKISSIIGTPHVLRQCETYIADYHPDVRLVAVQNSDSILQVGSDMDDAGIIEAEDFLNAHDLTIREREVAPYNQTRFAVLSRKLAVSTGYDATVFLTAPLKDRVGLLFDILGEFSKRGINLLDMRTETDIKSQKLQFYFEAEGHIKDRHIKDAIKHIENHIVLESRSIRVLGSFPRLDMRVKRIKNVGFIGSGAMSDWFAKRLENEGYSTILTGRSTAIRPEEMVPRTDVVFICVPISATAQTIEKYGPLMKDGQALILLAGEAENSIHCALQHTSPGVEILLIHNLWGPKAASMKDKNASLVRTPRSGILCSEIESFLYKHGADIAIDTPIQHDLLMGIGQKLPTAISIAMAMTLKNNNLSTRDIDSHSTLTSLYGILSMARVHSQNPRTYAEIMAAKGDGGKILRDFIGMLNEVIELAENGNIQKIHTLIEQGREYLSEDFLKTRMQQALAVDEILGMKT
ncbi:prephenate dehydratase domain-containing protein [Thermodesulfobacteriota bacterium]